MVVYSDGSACEEQDADLCVVGWALVANGGARQPVSSSGTLLFVSMMWTGQSFPSSFVEQGVNDAGGHPPSEARQRGRTFGMTSGAKSMPGAVWAAIFSVHKVKEHTTPDAVRAGIISALDWAGNDLAAACHLVVLAHAAPPSIQAVRCSANLAVTTLDCASCRVFLTRVSECEAT